MRLASAARVDCVDFHGIPVARDYAPFAQDALAPLFAGFDRCGALEGALKIDLQTSAERLVAPPDAAWRATFCHGLVQGYSKDDAHLLADRESQILVFPRAARITGQVFARAQRQVFAGMQHIALGLLLRERGVFDLHAATACTEQRALVILGDSGAGKTTLLLCLMALGCSFLGDDRLLFRVVRGDVDLLAYPREFHLSPTTLKLLPTSVSTLPLGPAPDGKYSVSPLAHWPERFRRRWQGPKTLLLPKIEPSERTSICRASAAEAFGRLLSSSAAVVVEAIDRGAEQLEALRLLADSSDAFSVTLGADLLAEPERTTRALLNQIESLAPRP